MRAKKGSRQEYQAINRIREFRAVRGLSMDKLAALVGTTGAQISRLENGDCRLTVEWMRRLAVALNISPADLIANTTALAEDVVPADIGAFGKAAADAGRGVKFWQVTGASVARAGCAPGEIIAANHTPPVLAEIANGAIVIVEMAGALVLRQWLRPDLLVTNRTGGNVVISTDDPTVKARIVEVVLGR